MAVLTRHSSALMLITQWCFSSFLLTNFTQS